MKPKRKRPTLLAAARGSVSVSKLKPLIEDSEAWAKEYIKREERNRARGAHREAAHFEDLVCAHQNFAGSLRQLVWAAENRKPTPNDRTHRRGRSSACELATDIARPRFGAVIWLAARFFIFSDSPSNTSLPALAQYQRRQATQSVPSRMLASGSLE